VKLASFGDSMTLHFWVAFAGTLALIFGVLHILQKSALWYGDWGSPQFEVRGSGAVFQGVLEVVLGVVLLSGSALDYLGIISFRPVMNVVKAFLEF
jgi:hypothetical protein